MARATSPVWHGTDEEARALLAAFARHCTCRRDTEGTLLEICPGHDMLANEQRVLDGLLSARRYRHRWAAAEHGGRSTADGAGRR